MAELAGQIADTKPKAQEGRGDDEVVFEAIQGTVAIVTEFVRVAEEIARSNNRDGALRVFHGFEAIGQQYTRPPRLGGIFRNMEFDYARFLGYELFVSFVAVLVRHERWELLGQVLNETLLIDTDEGPKAKSFSVLSANVGALHVYYKRTGNGYISPSAVVLKERHHDEGPLARLLPWRAFMDADFLLFLRAALDLPAEPFAYTTQGWRPWSFLFLSEVGAPEWLARCESRQYLGRICSAFGGLGADDFRARYGEHAPKAQQLFPESYGFPVRLPDPSKLGSRP